MICDTLMQDVCNTWTLLLCSLISRLSLLANVCMTFEVSSSILSAEFKGHVYIYCVKGGVLISYVCIVRPTHTYSLFPGNSGLVYCGYLDGVGDRDIVAIKTCKGTKF